MRQPVAGTFRKGKETLKKKAKELATLCDIPVCAVVVSPKGTIDTWPESQNAVKNIFDIYKKKNIQILDHHHRRGGDDRPPAYYETYVQFTEINDDDDDDHDEIMECLNSKIIAVEERIRFLMKINSKTD